LEWASGYKTVFTSNVKRQTINFKLTFFSAPETFLESNMNFDSILNILLVIFAFGFVIFWHELGHFLAARWAGVRVEQFAVGMGHAIVSYRRGLGLRLGNTAAEFQQRVMAEHAKRSTDASTRERELSLREKYDIAREIGLGETEYRLSWIPLGGYVKPTGQDDLRPAAQVQAGDPRAYGAAPVGKRMVIICAGVVMNVILAFALYVALFLYGFNAPPAVVGQVTPGSPAQAAGVQVGDQIISIDGHPQQDYTKLTMNVALLSADESSTFVVDRPGEGQKTLTVQPRKTVLNQNMPAIGVMPASTLRGPEKSADQLTYVSPTLQLLAGGGRVVRVGDIDVSNEETDAVLDQAVQQSAGREVAVVVQSSDGKQHALNITPTLLSPDFNREPSTIFGMLPRTVIEAVLRGAPAEKAGLQADDVVGQILAVGSGEPVTNPPVEVIAKTTAAASQAGRQLQMTVERGGVLQQAILIDTSFALETGGRGIGVSMRPDLGIAVVATVAKESAAERAGLRAGDRITRVAGSDTQTWGDVIAAARSASDITQLPVTVSRADAQVQQLTLALSADEQKAFHQLRFSHDLPLAPLLKVRSTTNPLVAARWGVEETKYSIFQVYTTLRRVFEGSVPLSNLSGPVGIFSAGSSAAARGTDWLIWFTALISANLAVVNFLPIPIVDGGLFTFLLIEKMTGRPPSPKLQAAAQVVGLMLLGSLFLFVTYHDILRQWG
jgi:regulator of sigma E protease